ncbi:hypothetical protein V8C42DRAFT_319701 [Trichoderma barbatum]
MVATLLLLTLSISFTKLQPITKACPEAIRNPKAATIPILLLCRELGSSIRNPLSARSFSSITRSIPSQVRTVILLDM